MFFEPRQALWCHNHCFGEPVLLPDYPLIEDPLPDIQPELPLLHLHDISLGLIGGHQREQISNCPSIPPCEEIVDHITFSDVVYNSSQG